MFIKILVIQQTEIASSFLIIHPLKFREDVDQCRRSNVKGREADPAGREFADNRSDLKWFDRLTGKPGAKLHVTVVAWRTRYVGRHFDRAQYIAPLGVRFRGIPVGHRLLILVTHFAHESARHRRLCRWRELSCGVDLSNRLSLLSFDDCFEHRYPFPVSSINFGFERLGRLTVPILIRNHMLTFHFFVFDLTENSAK